MDYFDLLDMLGVIVFAISGVLVAGRNKMDPIGVLVLASVTAVGGGTIRDVMLNHGPIFWFTDPRDVYLALVTAILALFFLKIPTKIPKYILPGLDAIGLAVFVAIGINKAIDADVNMFVAICMGVITGVGGGIIRDILAREIPMVFRTDIYATACIAGGLVHAICYKYASLTLEQASFCGMFITLLIRFSAIRWSLKLPSFSL